MIVERPVFGDGNPQNDYGLGFYCTRDKELAKEWACTEENSGYANEYELDLKDLSVMHLSGVDYNILNWLAVLLDNRMFRISNDVAAVGKEFLLDKFLPDVKPFDVMLGYRANDSYFSFANAFLNNTLSLAQLEKAMYLGKLGEQTVLISKKSFENIRFIQSEIVPKEIYYPKRNERDKEARVLYREERTMQNIENAVYLMDILRERWEPDDARIRRNIPS
jgi:hypothetical protein